MTIPKHQGEKWRNPLLLCSFSSTLSIFMAHKSHFFGLSPLSDYRVSAMNTITTTTAALLRQFFSDLESSNQLRNSTNNWQQRDKKSYRNRKKKTLHRSSSALLDSPVREVLSDTQTITELEIHRLIDDYDANTLNTLNKLLYPVRSCGGEELSKFPPWKK